MKRSRSSGTMWKWFYSYTAVLLLPVIFGVLIYLLSVRIISEQAAELQDQNAEKDHSYLEQTLDGIASNAQTILLNDDVTYFSERRTKQPGEAIRIRDVQDFLMGFRIANTAISSISIFYPGEDLIITDTNCMTMAQNTLLWNGMYLYGEPFNQILTEKPYNRLFVMEKGNTSYLFYAICGDSRKSFLEQELVVLITINQQTLTGQLKGDESSAFLLTAGAGEPVKSQETESVLLELGNPELAEIARQYMTGETEKGKRSEKEYYIRRQELSTYDVVMWNVYSNQEIRQKFQKVWMILAVYVLCCIVLGPVLIFFVSRKNYTPVEELIGLMESNGLSTGEKDEFAAIHSSLLGLLKGLRDNQRTLRQHQNFYEESDLYYLLCTDRARGSKVGGLGRNFPQDGFLVVSFEAEDAREVLRLEGLEPEDSLELLDFVIANVAQEFYADFPERIGGKLSDLYYVILNFPAEECAEKSYLVQEKTRSICQFLKERFEFSICANISRYKDSREILPEAYKELREITEFRDYIGSEELVLCYDTFSDDEEIRRELNYFTAVNQLSELLLAHRHKEAEALQEEIRQTWHTDEWTEADEREEKEEKEEPAGEKSSKTAEQTIAKVEKFLQEHYLDPQLTVSFIADLFGLNASYLSRSFCKVTGRGMLEYLTALRLEHAKACMEQGESVNSAAEHSGFYTCRPFIRAFKEEMGVTPGEYYKKKRERS